MDRRTLIAASAAAIAVPGAALAQEAARPVVRTSAGSVRGAAENGVWMFKGIPYGEPTGGAARFLAPKAAKAWTGVREAVTYGLRAPQNSPAESSPEAVERQRRTEPDGEDCLVLNVFALAPRAGLAAAPVMVWLHGGGYALGSGGPGADAQDIVRRHGVMVVTINHRLNLFGFMDLSSYDARYATSGVNGVLDIDLALRWVRDNAARFGGDPGKVTIFGQSGGGAKVSTMMAMPQSRGLFHRAIAMSGAVVGALSLEEARALTSDLLAQLKTTYDQLPKIPAGELLAAMDAIGAKGGPTSTRYNFGPVVDGKVLPNHPFDPRFPGPGANVPFMVGFMKEDTKPFYGQGADFRTMSEDDARGQLARAMRADAASTGRAYAAFHALYPRMTPGELVVEVTTQQMFGYPSWLPAERRAALRTAPTFLYRCDWKRPGPEGERAGAAHAEDLRLILGVQRTPANGADATRIEDMRTTLMQAWTSFARTGQPAAASLPAWPAYDLEQRAMMILNETSRLEPAPPPAQFSTIAALPQFHP